MCSTALLAHWPFRSAFTLSHPGDVPGATELPCRRRNIWQLHPISNDSEFFPVQAKLLSEAGPASAVWAPSQAALFLKLGRGLSPTCQLTADPVTSLALGSCFFRSGRRLGWQ